MKRPEQRYSAEDVERAARALYEAMGKAAPWGELAGYLHDELRSCALAVLDSLPERAGLREAVCQEIAEKLREEAPLVNKKPDAPYRTGWDDARRLVESYAATTEES